MNLLFVALSDLHLSDEFSILTNLALAENKPVKTSAGPTVEALVNFLHGLKHQVNQDHRIPYLILNGDILELAARSYPEATTFYRLFLSILSSRKIFDYIVYLPGNHDHALWGLIRDAYFVESLNKNDDPCNKTAYRHVTPLSLARKSVILEKISAGLPSLVPCPPHLVANPAYRLRSRSGHDFLFHHGHFLENLYQAMTILWKRIIENVPFDILKTGLSAESLKNLELDNWAWIDFVWSGFTRKGQVGQAAYDIYSLMKNSDGLDAVVERLVKLLDDELDLVKWFGSSFVVKKLLENLDDDLIRAILKKVIEKAGIGSAVRAHLEGGPFEEKLQKMCLGFLGHYMRRELEFEGYWPARDKTTFVFGHTHKPFLGTLKDNQNGFGEIKVANSGGWIVETPGDNHAYAPAMVLGANDGSIALVRFSFDDEEGVIETESDVYDGIQAMDERVELHRAVLAAGNARKEHLQKTWDLKKEILEKL